MKRIIISCTSLMVLASSAYAQSQTPTMSTDKPANAPAVHMNQTPPVAGKNSFTESQAKSRMESAGFTSVTDLRLDNQGIWRAKAHKDGKETSVSLDFQGNIRAPSP